MTPTTLAVLCASTAVPLALCLYIRRRFATPGTRPLVLMMLAVAWWGVTAIGWGLTSAVPLSLLWASAQFVAIVAAPPLWLLFIGQYIGTSWSGSRRVLVALLSAALAILLIVATHPWHGWVWPNVVPQDGGFPVFDHGPAFWLSAAYHWVLLLTGITVLFRAIQRSRREFRGQLVPLLLAVLLPVVANVFYLTGTAGPAGFDITPLTFAFSGVLLTWALYRKRLFDLIPVARDAMVDSLSDAVVVLDPARRVLDLNAAARQLAGNPAEWFGRPVDACSRSWPTPRSILLPAGRRR